MLRTVLVGSSTWGRWRSCEQDLGGPVLNLGKNSATIPDVIELVSDSNSGDLKGNVFIYCGGNDIWNGEQAENVAIRYEALIDLLLQSAGLRVFICSVFFHPLFSSRWNMIGELNCRIFRTAADRGLSVLDLNHHMERFFGARIYYSNDGVHLSQLGYQHLGRVLRTAITELECR